MAQQNRGDSAAFRACEGYSPHPCMGFGLSSGEAWLRGELAVHRSSTIDRGESGGDDLWAGSGLVRRE